MAKDTESESASEHNTGSHGSRPVSPHDAKLQHKTEEDTAQPELEESGDGTTSEQQRLHGVKLLLCLFSLALCMFCHALDQTIVATILTLLGEKFGDFDKVSWVTSGYMLPSAVLTVTVSSLSMVFGRKYAMVVSVVLFEAGSLISALSKDMNMIIGGRVLAGIGGCGIAVLTFMIATEITSIQKRGLMQGLFGAVFGIASICGPLIGGALSKVSFRWVFYINLPIGGCAVALIAFFFRPPRPKGTLKEKLAQVDYIGTVLLSSGLVLIMLALNLGSAQEPWDSAIVIAFFVVGGVLLIIYFLYNFNVVGQFCKHPMIPWRIVKVPQVLAPVLGLTFIFGGFMMCVLYLSIYFQVVRNADPMSSGIQLLPLIISMIISSILNGALITKTRYIKPFSMVGSVLATVGTGLLTLLDEHSGPGKRIGLLIIPGAGTGFVLQSSILAAQVAAPKANGGVLAATGLVSLGRGLGGAIGATLSQTVQSTVFAAQVASLSLPDGVDPTALVSSPDLIRKLPPALVEKVLHAFAISFQRVMYTALGFQIAGLVCTWIYTNKRIPKDVKKPAEDEETKVENEEKQPQDS